MPSGPNSTATGESIGRPATSPLDVGPAVSLVVVSHSKFHPQRACKENIVERKIFSLGSSLRSTYAVHTFFGTNVLLSRLVQGKRHGRTIVLRVAERRGVFFPFFGVRKRKICRVAAKKKVLCKFANKLCKMERLCKCKIAKLCVKLNFYNFT
jgi:hypothetical protein